MIYGATGYTGRLIAEQARREGLQPLLGGRNRSGVVALAQELNFDARIFSLDDPAAIGDALKDVAVVANCAGPFSATSAPMRAVCRTIGCHYVDITGEIAAFVAGQRDDAAARTSGVVVCPGVGFDVIPTDCIAAVLRQAMPDATHLALGFQAGGSPSPGTAVTLVEGLAAGGLIRANGDLRNVPLGYGRRKIDFGGGPISSAAIPWGDVATAWFTTGIPNIEVYAPMRESVALVLRCIDPLRFALSFEPVQNWIKAQARKRVIGPDQHTRASQRTRVWGEVSNARGERLTARVETANGYDVTVHGVLMAVRRLLSYQGPGGYFTPSQLLGDRCVEALAGSGRIAVVR